MPRKSSQKKPSKGSKIRFVRGTYKGCKGWLDATNGFTASSAYVIVDDDGEEIYTRVRQTSFRVDKEPTTWAEAAARQHPEIGAAVNEVAQLFASCAIKDEASIYKLIAEEISRVQKQHEKSNKKKVRRVKFNSSAAITSAAAAIKDKSNADLIPSDKMDEDSTIPSLPSSGSRSRSSRSR